MNLKGEVIGLVTTRAAENEGITFAIRIDNVREIIQQLISTGKVIRPWLGLRVVSLTPQIMQQLSRMDTFPDRKSGILVTSVLKGSPAEKGGILEGDVLFRVNGRDVSKRHEFLQSLGVFVLSMVCNV